MILQVLGVGGSTRQCGGTQSESSQLINSTSWPWCHTCLQPYTTSDVHKENYYPGLRFAGRSVRWRYELSWARCPLGRNVLLPWEGPVARKGCLVQVICAVWCACNTCPASTSTLQLQLRPGFPLFKYQEELCLVSHLAQKPPPSTWPLEAPFFDDETVLLLYFTPIINGRR